MSKTIVGIATAQVEGAISIIRLSGDQAIQIADQIFKGKEPLRLAVSHTIHYGKIVDPMTDELIDEVLVSVFLPPRTYTKEIVVEINCHGGIEITNEVCSLLVAQGAEMALPGEFTKRAFINGRIDLAQAEAIQDLIASDNQKAARIAMHALDGKLSQQIERFRTSVVDILAHIEVNIDYPEYDDVTLLTNELLVPQIAQLQQDIARLAQTADTGQVLSNGVKTAIIGRPNVGKSSLLNALLREQKAIVTNIAGTTRDIVEGRIKLGNITLHIIDTAGIRESNDLVEQIGIKKAKEVLETADLVLLVLDNSVSLEDHDLSLLEVIGTKKHIIIKNKSDLPPRLDVPSQYSKSVQVAISAQQEIGLENLYPIIAQVMNLDMIEQNHLFITNIRHRGLLNEAIQALEDAKQSAITGMPIDIVTIDLQNCYQKLGEILGVAVRDDLLDTLFANFCLGK